MMNAGPSRKSSVQPELGPVEYMMSVNDAGTLLPVSVAKPPTDPAANGSATRSPTSITIS